MRREKLFNRDGVYSAIVNHNLLMHHDATEYGSRILQSVFGGSRNGHPIKVLDLACGGLPISISDMMDQVTEAEFSYTGIDINPDQVELAAKYFEFPENVSHAQLIEANAWDLKTLQLEAPFDLIFTGLNLHHGTPEEIDYLMSHVSGLLSDTGIFLNHDWYRPDREVYVRRPSANPLDENESFRLVPTEELMTSVHPYPKTSVEPCDHDPEWRLQFIDGLTDSYWDRKNDDKGANTLKSHMLARDYPVSREDFEEILDHHDFYYRIFDYDNPDIAICPFLAMPAASKHEGVFQQIIEAVD